MGRTHVLTGALASGALAVVVGPGPSWVAPILVVTTAAGAAALPDLDEPGSTVARLAGPVTRVVAVGTKHLAGGHRHATHSLLGAVCLGALVLACVVPFVVAGACVIGALGLLAWRCAAPWGLRHSILACAFGAVLGLADLHVRLGAVLAVAVLLGYLVHLGGDVVTTGGVPLWWPARRMIAYPVLEDTDSGRERLLAALVGLLALFILFHFGVAHQVQQAWDAGRERVDSAWHALAGERQRIVHITREEH